MNYLVRWYDAETGRERIGKRAISLDDAEFMCRYMSRWYPSLEHTIVTIGD